MYRCESSASAYLDPRPSPETIGLAYQKYFTHSKAPSFSSLSPMGKLRRWLGNGYRNHRFGTRDYPASIFGAFAVRLMPDARASMDAGMRHLQKTNAKERLLDVGCGSGQFMRQARSAGWEVVGVDLDPKAIDTACKQGLDVRLGGVDIVDPSAEQFDVIILGHVIEHVHHPVEVLRACYRLLKPGGYLWIETPNIAATGHEVFGENWRGLEPPRHLVLFNLESIRNALSTAGFAETEVQSYRRLCDGIFRSSKAIADGIDPYSELSRNSTLDIVREAERTARGDPQRREFIALKAWKQRA